MPRCRNALFDRFDFGPHEISELNQKHPRRVKHVQIGQRCVGCKHVKRIKAQAQIGHVGLANNVPGLGKFIDCSTPRQGFVGNFDV